MGSLLARFLTPEVASELRDRRTPRGFGLDDLIASGIANPDSSIGVYAPDAESYDVFAALLTPIVRAHHGVDTGPPIGPGLFQRRHGVLDEVLSTRVRVARNLGGFAFPAGLTAVDRREVERRIVAALSSLPGDLAGHHHRLRDLSPDERRGLIGDHLLFKAGDRFLEAAGITRDWPDARGIFLSNDRRLVAWVNEEDHLRLIAMQPGGDLGEVTDRLDRAHAHLASRLEFAQHPRLGYLASCPSNLGTGMRASVHRRLDGTPGPAAWRARGIQIRGVHGEHSEAEGGVWDLSPIRRLGVSPDDIAEVLTGALRSI